MPRSPYLMAAALAGLLLVSSPGAAQDCSGAPAPADAATLAARLAHADCLIASGQGVRALAVLEDALDAAVSSAEAVAVQGRTGRVLAALGDHESARLNLSAALEQAEAAGDAQAAAALLNDLGTVYLANGQPLAGLSAFSDAARLAEGELAVRAGINLARALFESGSTAGLGDRLGGLGRGVAALGDSAAKVEAGLALAELYRETALANAGSSPALRREAFTLADQAFRQADLLGDRRLMSFAAGLLGRIYADAGESDTALAHTRRAALLAQEIGADDSLYRWQWQTGRLLKLQGRNRDAVIAYRSAVDTLTRMGPAHVTSQRQFEREVAPLYSEYADMLLASTAGSADEPARGALIEVQRALEQFRVAEVQNYFANQCVLPDAPALDAPRGGAAVIYPVLLADRVEILLNAGGALSQFTVAVGLDQLTREVRALRDAIELEDPGREFLASAQTLYRWLIEPLETALDTAGPGTLVIVPDGPLRTIPLAVLHDGERFLIERYALSTTPGLSLVPVDAASAGLPSVLANGIVEPVRGFPGLPFVADELSSIAQMLPAATFTDEEFLTGTLAGELLVGEYSIVHLATHAQFESNYRNSFLLAYDDVITMDQLEDVIGIRRFSDRPIDLLVLSACQTAAGDDRAALGLAGVAVKAGARSALASLWLINDESTSVLMSEFYRRLAGGEETKADALRGAQLLLLNDPRYRHPTYWAPFLLIGDWR